LKLRFKDKDGKNQLAHTKRKCIGFAKVLAGILENYQTQEEL
jgi:seryl-tRNA synthetase